MIIQQQAIISIRIPINQSGFNGLVTFIYDRTGFDQQLFDAPFRRYGTKPATLVTVILVPRTFVR